MKTQPEPNNTLDHFRIRVTTTGTAAEMEAAGFPVATPEIRIVTEPSNSTSSATLPQFEPEGFSVPWDSSDQDLIEASPYTCMVDEGCLGYVTSFRFASRLVIQNHLRIGPKNTPLIINPGCADVKTRWLVSVFEREVAKMQMDFSKAVPLEVQPSVWVVYWPKENQC